MRSRVGTPPEGEGIHAHVAHAHEESAARHEKMATMCDACGDAERAGRATLPQRSGL
jgi:hypothetical protein